MVFSNACRCKAVEAFSVEIKGVRMKRENAYLTDKQVAILKDQLLSEKEIISNKKLE